MTSIPRMIRALAAFAAAIALIPASARSQNCDVTSVGLTALTDLGDSTYRGYRGGLYPDGENVRPPAHETGGIVLARDVVPRDAAGAVDPVAGRIVLLSIGMSNTTQEFSAFRTLAAQDPLRNSRVNVVDGAQGGQTAKIISDSSANFWTVVDQRLAQAGATRAQVQAVWLKEADANPTDAFPVHALTLDAELVEVLHILRARFPNCRLVYLSSRIYAGYATTTLNPEPYAYESGFAVKWLIERQIAGEAGLQYPDEAPWIAWGPYLWSDGERGRSDSLKWFCTEFSNDGTHPAATGREKVARLLLDFFQTDATARSWYLAGTPSAVAPPAPPWAFAVRSLYPNPAAARVRLDLRLPRSAVVNACLVDVLGRIVRSRTVACDEGDFTLDFDIAGLSPGAYRVLVTDGRTALSVPLRTLPR
jgi:hypothetical protein